MLSDFEYCVYKHTNKMNGMVYIGITRQNPIKRWGGGSGYSYNTHFYNAILKYGWDNFSHEILYTGMTREEACEKEIELIAKYNSNDRKYGYNITPGGDTLDEESIQKVASKKRGVKFTEEHKLALSKAKKGKKWTESQRESIMRSMKCGAEHRGARAVNRYTIDGEYIDTMPCARMYCEIIGNENAYKHICNVCRGKRISAYGYKWAYAEEVDDK